MTHDLEYEDYMDATRQLLEQSKQEKEPYTVDILGKKFVVLPNVFSPKYFYGTKLFAEHLPIKAGEDLLEIGPGTGALSIMAAYKGARKVVCIDINPDAVRNTEENIKLHNLEDKVEVRQGDIFQPLKSGEVFDTIFWNTPWGYVEDEIVPDLEKSVFDPHYQSNERFIKEAKRHLKEGGKVLIAFSTILGRFDLLQQFAKEVGFALHKLYEEQGVEIHPVPFQLFELRPQ